MNVKIASSSESTLTERYQTTIPQPIRKILGLNKGDKICYTIQSDGKVVISRTDRIDSDSDDDPILGQFLNFLAQDIKQNPHHVTAISIDLVNHVRSLVSEVDLDLNAPLLDEDE